jgi:hypothetical protein
VADPVLVALLIVIQDGAPLVVQVHPSVVVTETVPVEPEAPLLMSPGVTE